MDYDQIVRSGKFVDEGGYSPQPLDDDGKRTGEKSGTRVLLSQLKITRAIPEVQFRRSMARGLFGDIEALAESIRRYSWTTLASLKGDAQVLQKIEETEKLLKELRKTLSR